MVPAVIQAYRKQTKGIPIEKLAHRYFDVLREIQESKKKKDISALLSHCNMALCLLEPWIKYEKKESGQVPPVIPAIPEGATFFHAINGARSQLKNIQDIVEFFPELEHYQYTVEQGFVMLDVAAKIRKHVGGNPVNES